MGRYATEPDNATKSCKARGTNLRWKWLIHRVSDPDPYHFAGYETFDNMDPDPVAKPTPWENDFFLLKIFLFYFISIQTKANLVINKKHVYNAWLIEFSGGGEYMSHTHSFSQDFNWRLHECITISINRILLGLKNGVVSKKFNKSNFTTLRIWATSVPKIRFQ